MNQASAAWVFPASARGVAGWGHIQNGAEGQQRGCLPAAVAAAIVPPSMEGGTAVGELMRIAKWGGCVEIQGRGCGGSTGHAHGAFKVTENSPKCLQLPSSQGLGCFCGWSGKATAAAAACPSAPSGESPAESEGGGRVL